MLKLKRYYSTQSKLAGISNHLEEGWKTVLFFCGSYKLTHLKRGKGTPGDMALWNRPCLGPLVLQKEVWGANPISVGESLAGPLLVSLAGYLPLVRLGWPCYASPNNNNNNRKPSLYGVVLKCERH